MDNVLETTGVPLTVFGGAVPELAPEDLPEGASPFNQDVDFNPGSVFTRGGRQNQIQYSQLFQLKFPGFAASIPGQFDPNEAIWGNPGAVKNGTPGVYASAEVNRAGAGGPLSHVDFASATGTIASDLSSIGGTVNGSFSDLIIYMQLGDAGRGCTTAATGVPAQLTNLLAGAADFNANQVGKWGVVPAGTPISINATNTGNVNYPMCFQALMGFPTNGLTVAVTNIGGSSGGFAGPTTILTASNLTVPAGLTLIGIVASAFQPSTTNPPILGAFSDNHGNVWTQIAYANADGFYAPDIQHYGGTYSMWICTNYIPDVGNYQFGIPITNASTMAAANLFVYGFSNLSSFTSVAHTQQLQTLQYPFTIASNVNVLGLQLLVTGHQTNADPTAILTATATGPPGSASGSGISFQLPAADGTVTVGLPNTAWGELLSPALLNNPGFGFNIVGQANPGVDTTFDISGIQIKAWISPPKANYNWMHTYEQTNGQVDTLALDSNGVLYDEQVNYGNGPGVLTSIFQNIFQNTFAKGVTFGDIEYIAFSNLLNGTDIPRQWNSVNFDRISMVGPGGAPTVASSGGSGGGNVLIQNITQNAPVQIRRIAWGTVNSPADSTPGNLLVVFGEGRTGANTYASLFPYTAIFGTGTTVVLSGIPNPFPKKDSGSVPFNINGSYTVQQVTTGIVGGNESCPIFTIPSPTTIWAYSADFGSGGVPTSGWFYQSCLATITMQAPVPNVGVGSSIQITGTGGSPPSGYDGTWTILQAPNASNMTINNAQLTAGSCLFSYTLVAGSANPQVGQIVTITNCLNNGQLNPDPNVFNKTFTIASVGGGNFTVAIGSGDTGFQNQVGNVPQATAVIGGTVFVFDAGQIVGTKTGGNVVGQGQIGVGVRKVCYSFLTRSGFITQPSPIAPFNVTSGSGQIVVSGLATGPPNVVARIVSFTGAGGGNFFYIPQTVSVSVGGVTQVNTSTIVKDNSSTTATFSFSDAVLLTATAIDIPGSNLFNTIELGSSRGLLTYGSRMFAWGEQNKITNLRNLSFDGGFAGVNVQGGTIQVPLGWQLDATNGSGGSLNTSSPVFGWAYQIQNISGGTQASWGMLEQRAFQDEFGVPIVQASTLYSVRITAQVNPVPVSGNLVVDLINSASGVVVGQFVLPLNSMTTNMGLYTGTLLTTPGGLQPVDPTLFIRIWAQNIPNNTTILIDRVEPYPTLVPSFTTALKASYVNNQEAFDLNTGVCGPAQNMQPINGAMELFDLLYALKEKSWFSTFDNGVTEPNQWNWKEVSNKVGTIGINSYDWGEGWALTANRDGVYFFEGGEPIKVSQEIQPLWDQINWQYGYTIWVRNDPANRRFMVGIPIATPQQAWLPEFPVNANPTSPNVILMCNYRELNTGSAIAQTGPIRATFQGRLMSPEPARKWSFWNILCPYSDFIDRANNQWPPWFGTGYLDNKIFQLFQTQLSDDGVAVNSFWVSYGFVKPETQEAKGMGLFRMEFPYLTMLATGLGTLTTMVYPESPLNQPYILDPLPLPSISQGDLEVGVNIKGNRFFIRVGTNAVGSAFRCSKLVVPLIADTWSPVRGYNAVTA
jgi:hypothetical protein